MLRLNRALNSFSLPNVRIPQLREEAHLRSCFQTCRQVLTRALQMFNNNKHKKARILKILCPKERSKLILSKVVRMPLMLSLSSPTIFPKSNHWFSLARSYSCWAKTVNKQKVATSTKRTFSKTLKIRKSTSTSNQQN